MLINLCIFLDFFLNAWYLQTWTCWFRLFLSAAAERMMLGGNPGSFIVGRAEGGDPRSGQGGSTLGILSWSRCGKIKRRWELTGAILATRRSSQVSFAHSHLQTVTLDFVESSRRRISQHLILYAPRRRCEPVFWRLLIFWPIPLK